MKNSVERDRRQHPALTSGHPTKTHTCTYALTCTCPYPLPRSTFLGFSPCYLPFKCCPAVKPKTPCSPLFLVTLWDSCLGRSLFLTKSPFYLPCGLLSLSSVARKADFGCHALVTAVQYSFRSHRPNCDALLCSAPSMPSGVTASSGCTTPLSC